MLNEIVAVEYLLIYPKDMYMVIKLNIIIYAPLYIIKLTYGLCMHQAVVCMDALIVASSNYMHGS